MGDEGGAGDEEAVKVFVRIRPLNGRELEEKQTIGWDFNESSMLEDTPNGQRVYAYDRCFGPTSTNQETYDIVGKPVVVKAMEGYNGTVFTYGQTGSGKTWTMRGCESDPGMMILCIRDIMDHVRKNEEKLVISLKVSYLEVYNEEINDLLGEVGSSASKNLKIVSEDAARGAVIGNLVEEPASSPEEFMAILQRGEASRSYASTEMNNESSRSHTIYRVAIDTRERLSNGSASAASRVSYLNLVDLAGSERQKSTKAEGKTLKEGANINKSLLALGAVINKLGDANKKTKGGKQAFIPYRDSKLTRILKQSLGGNTLTSVLCAVTPAPMHREETVSTLKFGQLCKSIKNKVQTNDGALDDKALIRQYRNTINEQRAQLEALQKIIAASPDMLAAAAASTASTASDPAGAGGGAGGGGAASAAASSVNAEELARLKEQAVEQQSLLGVLQARLDEYQDLEESKAAFEEYEQHSRQELDDDIAKLEEDKAQIQNERYKLLKDRTSLDEKEGRVNMLVFNLDEKESKLRQLMGLMKDQEEQWNRSVSDLKCREDLVKDWQENHQTLERRREEAEAMQRKKFKELNEREAGIVEAEARGKAAQRELQEREHRLQGARSRLANSEQALAAKEEQLAAKEQTLKKREIDADVRERDLQSRRKEMESWDVLLREKDRKIGAEQARLDEREALVSGSEARVKQRDVDSERRAQELRQGETEVAEQSERYQTLLAEVEARDRLTQEQQREAEALREEQAAKQAQLGAWEQKLQALQKRMANVDQRETELEARVAAQAKAEFEFFNVKVAQITSRHSAELQRLEGMVQQQLKIVEAFQKELADARADLAQKDAQIEELEATVDHQHVMIDNLKDGLSLSDDEGDSVYTTESGVTPVFSRSRNPAHAPVHSSASGAAELSDDEGTAAGMSSGPDGPVTHTKTSIPFHANNPHNPHCPQQQHYPSPQQQHQQHQQQQQHDPPGAGQQQQTAQGLGIAHGGLGIGLGLGLGGGVGELLGLSPGQEFLLQLAVTQRALGRVLEQHGALPDQHNGGRLQREELYRTFNSDAPDLDGGDLQHDLQRAKDAEQQNSQQQSMGLHGRRGSSVSLAAGMDGTAAAAASGTAVPAATPLPPSSPDGRISPMQRQQGLTSSMFSRARRDSAVSLPETPAALQQAARTSGSPSAPSEGLGIRGSADLSDAEGADEGAGTGAVAGVEQAMAVPQGREAHRRKSSVPMIEGDLSPDVPSTRRASIANSQSVENTGGPRHDGGQMGLTAASAAQAAAVAAGELASSAEEKQQQQSGNAGRIIGAAGGTRRTGADGNSGGGGGGGGGVRARVVRAHEPPASVRWGHHSISTVVVRRSPTASAPHSHQFSRAQRNLGPGSAHQRQRVPSPPWKYSPHSARAQQAGGSYDSPEAAEAARYGATPGSGGGGSSRDGSPVRLALHTPPPPPPLVQTGGHRNGIPVTTVNLQALSHAELKRAVSSGDIPGVRSPSPPPPPSKPRPSPSSANRSPHQWQQQHHRTGGGTEAGGNADKESAHDRHGAANRPGPGPAYMDNDDGRVSVDSRGSDVHYTGAAEYFPQPQQQRQQQFNGHPSSSLGRSTAKNATGAYGSPSPPTPGRSTRGRQSSSGSGSGGSSTNRQRSSGRYYAYR